MFIQIALAILVLASLVVAYFSAKTWHWAHVLVVLGVFLAGVGYLFLAAETLRINGVLRSQANQLREQLADVQARIAAVEKGTDDLRLISALAADELAVPEEAEELPGLRDLDHRLHLKTRLRGRVWRDVMPAGVDPQTGTVRAIVEAPQPSGIRPDTILFLFEQGEPAQPDPTRGAQYLGQFRVTGVVEKEVTLEPIAPLDEIADKFELERLSHSSGPWVFYETMPVDQHDLLAGQSEEQLRQELPEQSVQEYIRDGTEAGPDDDQWHRAGYDEEGNLLGPDDTEKAVRVAYRRRLRDYTVEFEELARERVLLLADVNAVTTDNQRLQTALASARELQGFREEELRKLQIDLAGVTKEREAIESHLAMVEQQLADIEQQLASTLRENRRLADELTAIQLRLKAKIDEETSLDHPVLGDPDQAADPLALNSTVR